MRQRKRLSDSLDPKGRFLYIFPAFGGCFFKREEEFKNPNCFFKRYFHFKRENLFKGISDQGLSSFLSNVFLVLKIFFFRRN